MKEQKFNHRILLLSDPHYMPNESVAEYSASAMSNDIVAVPTTVAMMFRRFLEMRSI